MSAPEDVEALADLDRMARHTEYDPETGCLNWTSVLDKSGYGKLKIGSRTNGSARMVRAHRFAYEVLVGPVADGLVLDHFICDNKRCWSITHVRPVTRRENNLRSTSASALNRAKTTCPAGHPYDAVFASTGKRYCRKCRRFAEQQKRDEIRATTHPTPKETP